MQRPEITFEQVSVGEITPYANNPRHHSKAQVRRIMASMAEVGCTNPLLVDEAGVLIAGHGRLQAAIGPGLQSLPVVRVQGLTPA